MRKSLHFIFLLLSVVLLTTPAKSQADRFAYAVTDVQQDGANWSFLRKLDLQTGESSKILLNGNDPSAPVYDAVTQKQLTTQLKDAFNGNTINAAFGTGVAAIAYDKKNNRLYYTPMFVDQLRYIDIKTMKVFFVTGFAFTGMAQKSSDQGNIITRMVIAADGNGYAMTNDGAHLIRFTTGKKLKVTDLGMLVDDPANKGFSIHSSCSSFGGDMIADKEDNLYVISARNNVFKVNIETRAATYLGAISGLPANFTANGAAVDDNNQLIICSAMNASSYFVVNTNTWAASPFKTTGIIWRSSDLANSNLLNTNNTAAIMKEIPTRTIPVTVGTSKIQIYPNPVTNNQFTIQFNELENGNYTLQVTDVMGRQVLQQAVNIGGDNQVQNIKLDPSNTKGIYLVKVTDRSSNVVFSKKLVVQ
jgi:Secretion system C-terminal sorting domain